MKNENITQIIRTLYGSSGPGYLYWLSFPLDGTVPSFYKEGNCYNSGSLYGG